jgi:uncharacterized membrane protein YeaQ/YmgE (transglycosylase-associated protein family)/uncharacterized protein YjbJ (UPF0337 family)
MINFIVWLIVGAITGWLATFIIRRRQSIVLFNIFLGSLGAFVSGYLFSPVFHIDTTSFSLIGVLVSLGGSIVLLVVVNFFIREHTVTNAVLEERWSQVRMKVHNRWNRLTEEDIDQIDGKHDRLISLIENRYGITQKEAERQLQGFLGAVTSRKSWLFFLRNRAQDANPPHDHNQ